MRLFAVLAFCAISLLAACGADSPTVDAEQTGLPDVARVVCETDGTRVTPLAKPQRDGIHLEILNQTGKDLALEIGESDGEPVMGTNADRGTSKEVLDLAPGAIWLRCSEGGWAQIEVVDEDDVWIEGTGATPGCETTVSGTSYFGPDSRGYPTPAEAVREQFSAHFEPGDVLEQVGYPEEDTPTLSIVRDGVSVWGFQLVRDEAGGWIVDTDSRCG
jgi:hypothetical protein